MMWVGGDSLKAAQLAALAVAKWCGRDDITCEKRHVTLTPVSMTEAAHLVVAIEGAFHSSSTLVYYSPGDGAVVFEVSGMVRSGEGEGEALAHASVRVLALAMEHTK